MWKRLLLIRGAELAVLALLAAIPLMVDNSYVLGLLTLLAIYGILLIGLDVTVGYLGQVNLAQAAFLGLGAYAAGLCVANFDFGIGPAKEVFDALQAYARMRAAYFQSLYNYRLAIANLAYASGEPPLADGK